MAKINELIAALNTISEKNIFEIYIPSIKRPVKFRPLSAKQQRAFYTCLNEKVVFNTQFILTTFNIIKESCVESDLVDTFNIFDRAAILLALRINAIGNLINVEKDENTYVIDLLKCLEKFKVLDIPSEKTIITQNITIDLQTPTLFDQYRLEKELRDKDVESMPFSSLIEDIITGEICKLIKEINIDQVKTGYKDLTFKERVAVVELLPANIVFELQEFAEIINDKMKECLTSTTEVGENITFDITVDFFLDR